MNQTKMRITYIAHPIGGDVENNLACLRKIIKHINLTEPYTVPFCPYYADVVSLDDNVPAERERGIRNDIAILSSGMVNELRLCGPVVSKGMMEEVKIALQMKIPVVCYNEKLFAQIAPLLLMYA